MTVRYRHRLRKRHTINTDTYYLWQTQPVLTHTGCLWRTQTWLDRQRLSETDTDSQWQTQTICLLQTPTISEKGWMLLIDTQRLKIKYTICIATLQLTNVYLLPQTKHTLNIIVADKQYFVKTTSLCPLLFHLSQLQFIEKVYLLFNKDIYGCLNFHHISLLIEYFSS